MPPETKNVRYQCSICYKILNTPQGINTHLRITHSNVKKFKCDECDKVFKYRSNMVVHKKTHNSSKVKCIVCENLFSTRGNLKKHLKKHFSTEEQVQKLWDDNYLTENSIKYGKKDRAMVVKTEPDTKGFDNSFFKTEVPDKDVVVVKNEIINYSRRINPNRRNLRLAGLLTNAVEKFTVGMLFPLKINEPTDTDFEVSTPSLCRYKCPIGCPYEDDKESILIHVELSHKQFVQDVCNVCLIKVRNMEQHVQIHQKAFDISKFDLDCWSIGKSIIDPKRNENENILDYFINLTRTDLDKSPDGILKDTQTNSQISSELQGGSESQIETQASSELQHDNDLLFSESQIETQASSELQDDTGSLCSESEIETRAPSKLPDNSGLLFSDSEIETRAPSELSNSSQDSISSDSNLF